MFAPTKSNSGLRSEKPKLLDSRTDLLTQWGYIVNPNLRSVRAKDSTSHLYVDKLQCKKPRPNSIFPRNDFVFHSFDEDIEVFPESVIGVSPTEKGYELVVAYIDVSDLASLIDLSDLNDRSARAGFQKLRKRGVHLKAQYNEQGRLLKSMLDDDPEFRKSHSFVVDEEKAAIAVIIPMDSQYRLGHPTVCRSLVTLENKLTYNEAAENLVKQDKKWHHDFKLIHQFGEAIKKAADFSVGTTFNNPLNAPYLEVLKTECAINAFASIVITNFVAEQNMLLQREGLEAVPFIYKLGNHYSVSARAQSLIPFGGPRRFLPSTITSIGLDAILRREKSRFDFKEVEALANICTDKMPMLDRVEWN